MTNLPPLPGITRHYEEIQGLRVHVAEAGDGPPLILQHGWPQHWYAWHAVVPILAEHFRVICPDMRGVGWTDAPANGYDQDGLANDLLNICDALGLERVSIAVKTGEAMSRSSSRCASRRELSGL